MHSAVHKMYIYSFIADNLREKTSSATIIKFIFHFIFIAFTIIKGMMIKAVVFSLFRLNLNNGINETLCNVHEDLFI